MYSEPARPQFNNHSPAATGYFPLATGLPEKYGQEGVTLLVRDPLNLFAFWETDGLNAMFELHEVHQEGLKLIIRFPVPNVGSRTIPVPQAGASYVGYIVAEDRVPLQSSVVTTPPTGPSLGLIEDLPTIHALQRWSGSRLPHEFPTSPGVTSFI